MHRKLIYASTLRHLALMTATIVAPAGATFALQARKLTRYDGAIKPRAGVTVAIAPEVLGELPSRDALRRA